MDGNTTRNNARRDFYERLGGLSMAPLWESLHQLVPPAPAPRYVPAAWDYDKVRPFLIASDWRPVALADKLDVKTLVAPKPEQVELFG